MNRLIRIISVFLFFSAVAAFGCFRIIDTDIWLYLRSGEHICRQLCIPRTDIFSYTALGRPWIDAHWFAQVFFYLVHAASGAAGLTLIRLLTVLGIFALLYRCCRAAAGRGVTLAVLTLALLVSNERFLMKPSLLALFLATLYIVVLERCRRDRRGTPYVLLLIQLVWTNVHPSFFLGPLLILFYFIDSRIRPGPGDGRAGPRLGLLFFLSAGACLASPYGPLLLLQPARQLSSPLFRDRVLPWAPASFSFPTPLSGRAFMVMFALCIASIVLNARRLRPAHLLVAAFFGYLACTSRRHMALFALLSAPGTCYNLAGAARAGAARFPRQMKLAGAGSLVCLCLVLLTLLREVTTDAYYVRQRSLRRSGLGASRIAFPDAALDFIESRFPGQRVFCNYDIGSYVAARLYPGRRVNIDGRNLVYGEDLFREYLEAMEGVDGLEAFAEKYNVSALIFSHNSRDVKTLLPHLWKSPDWKLVYADERAVVFSRGGGDSPPAEEELSSCRVKGLPSKYGFPLGELRAGEFLFTLGLTDCAEDVLRRAIGRYPALPEARNFLGIMAVQRGDRETAVKEFLAACSLSLFYPEPHINLSTILLEEGNRDGAMRHALTAVKISPSNARARGALGLAYMNGGEHGKAERELLEAVRRDVGDPELHNNLGTVYELQGKTDDARREYETGRSLSDDYFAARFNLARICTLDGDLDRALSLYGEALTLEPGQTGALKNMAVIHASRGDREAARALLEEAAGADPSDRETELLLRKLIEAGPNKPRR